MLLINTVFNQLATKVNCLEDKIPNTAGFINESNYNFEKPNPEERLKMLMKNTQRYCFSY